MAEVRKNVEVVTCKKPGTDRAILVNASEYDPKKHGKKIQEKPTLNPAVAGAVEKEQAAEEKK